MQKTVRPGKIRNFSERPPGPRTFCGTQKAALPQNGQSGQSLYYFVHQAFAVHSMGSGPVSMPVV